MKKVYGIVCPACNGHDKYCKICVGVGKVPRDMYMTVMQHVTKTRDENIYRRYTPREERMIISGEYSIPELCKMLHRSYRSIDSKRRKLKMERSEKVGKEERGDNADTFGQG